MLSLETLFKKPNTTVDGESIVDLTASTFSFGRSVSIIGSGIVSSDLEMRPDLVAQIYYGDDSKLDYILKFNGISNPFSLEAGTVLLIGDMKDMQQNFIKGDNNDPEKKVIDIRKKFFDENRLSKKDVKRLELIKKKSDAEGNNASLLPPNFAEEGSKEIKVKDGIVIFGGDVVSNADSCKDAVHSRARVKEKLLQKKIFG